MIDKIETTLRPRTNQGMRKVEESQHTKSAATCFYNQNFPVFEPAIEKVKIHENSKIIMDKAEESLTIRKVSIVESLAVIIIIILLRVNKKMKNRIRML